MASSAAASASASAGLGGDILWVELCRPQAAAGEKDEKAAAEEGQAKPAWRLESCGGEPDSLALWSAAAAAATAAEGQDGGRAPRRQPLYSRLIDLQMRAAAPGGSAILVSQMSSADNASEPRPPAVAVGVIDSGYRGRLRAIVWTPRLTIGPPRAPPGLALRLTLVRLAAAAPRMAAGPPPGARNPPPAATPLGPGFAARREEDAGHDIIMPCGTAVAPGEDIVVQLPAVRAAADESEEDAEGVYPYVFGRSSCNLRGLVVLPTAWPPGRPCRFVLRNVTGAGMYVEAGQRVAQLLLLTRRLEWLPRGFNAREPFPRSPRAAPPAAEAPPGLRWRCVPDLDAVAPPSARGADGFGSTGL
ncbi:deoxyuridine triphosphatase [Cervid alphaherpesvirus 2]|uniref:Deoxyuridine triphosphatase n=1 Tax=Cervid alphaherpesvirus 2 TaxID=365327 RepID=A0A455JIT7_9ALPH|nr:deoxyuridine triphosphatase [Cervid alphaherpesvirus 2]AVT50729.1 deoxyuridine triphosphatase [Cervid alphaherpesvirus 2]